MLWTRVTHSVFIYLNFIGTSVGAFVTEDGIVSKPEFRALINGVLQKDLKLS